MAFVDWTVVVSVDCAVVDRTVVDVDWAVVALFLMLEISNLHL